MAFDTSQFREFRYGWPVVLVSTFGISLGMAPLPFYTIGVFAQPLAEEFGWGIDQILLGLMPFYIVTVISAPMAGYLSDRHGLLLRLRLLTLHGCRFCNQGDRRDALAACLTEFLGNPEKAKYAFNLIEQRVGRKTNNFPNYSIALEMERLRSEEKMTLGKAAEKIQRNQSLSISPRQITNIYRKYRDDDAYRAWKAALRDLEE